MTLRDLIPKDKFDNSTIKQLCKLTDNEIRPIIFDLLEWLQDYNWPIAKDILPIVILHQNIAIPHIITILQGNNMMWKYWIIELVIPYLIYPNKQLLKSELERLSSFEIINDDIDEIVKMSKNCLTVYYT
ncbi:DUF5071 domain-containing protein [Clostridium intestinale]|uniref:DUF5071 domain-containing protein n=1 Tax=Clostridium intestinale DSM 6191 TaxID=1121320 RepID=A0A1M5T3G9_9CLOT|nr:DUF5071 domain-containing protein [Clostridium intestinale]SHH45291.1 protein of unknown function [Clostridium intestinale DSM 6191]